MTESQKTSLKKLLEVMGADTLFHGDCVGADAQAHTIALLELGIPIILYPPDNPDLRAFSSGAVTSMPSKPYLERNHDMVDAAHSLIAAPDGFKEVLRSGTWATIRYARREGKSSYVIYPDGRIRIDN
jgi:hypothetical protein